MAQTSATGVPGSTHGKLDGGKWHWLRTHRPADHGRVQQDDRTAGATTSEPPARGDRSRSPESRSLSRTEMPILCRTSITQGGVAAGHELRQHPRPPHDRPILDFGFSGRQIEREVGRFLAELGPAVSSSSVADTVREAKLARRRATTIVTMIVRVPIASCDLGAVTAAQGSQSAISKTSPRPAECERAFQGRRWLGDSRATPRSMVAHQTDLVRLDTPTHWSGLRQS